MKVEHKAHSQLNDEQRAALADIHELKPGFQLAIRAALETYVAGICCAQERTSAECCAVLLLQAMRTDD